MMRARISEYPNLVVFLNFDMVGALGAGDYRKEACSAFDAHTRSVPHDGRSSPADTVQLFDVLCAARKAVLNFRVVYD